MDKKVIIRIWQGIIKSSDADIYLKYIEETGIKNYTEIEGNLSAKILRRLEGNICHFLTITEWDSYESIKKFAGDDFETAKYYPLDQKFLLEFEEKVQRFETTIYED